MARAKRTHRAEARRRSRELQSAPGATADDGAPSTTLVTAAQGTDATSGGILPRFSAPNVGEDLRALPRLVLSRRFLIPVLLMVGGLMLYLSAWSGGPESAQQNQLLALVANMAIGSPSPTYVPALSIFLGGYLALRGSYLVGMLLALINAALSIVLMRLLADNPAWNVPIPESAPPATYRQLFESVFQPANLGSYFVQAAVWGIAVGAAAAWYRRFLQRSAERRRLQMVDRTRQRQLRERERAQEERRRTLEERRKGRSGTTGSGAGRGTSGRSGDGGKGTATQEG